MNNILFKTLIEEGIDNELAFKITMKFDDKLSHYAKYDPYHDSIFELFINKSCELYGITREDFFSGSRKRYVSVLPRQVCCYLVEIFYIRLGFRKMEFERYAGRAGNHCAQIHGAKTIKNLISYDKDFNNRILDLICNVELSISKMIQE